MPETILNCDVSILHHDGESNADAAARLAGLLDSELCHLADHEISVRARGPAVPFWYGTPEGTVKVMAVDGKDAEAFIYGKYPKNDVSHATDPAPSKPTRVFWTRTALGPLPDGYDDIYAYIPGLNRIVHVSEGTGDNLLKEDADEGYVDYLNYTCYELDGGVEESEGGMVLFRSLIHDKFHCLGEALPMVFEEAYDDSVQGFVLLSDRFLPDPRTTD